MSCLRVYFYICPQNFVDQIIPFLSVQIFIFFDMTWHATGHRNVMSCRIILHTLAPQNNVDQIIPFLRFQISIFLGITWHARGIEIFIYFNIGPSELRRSYSFLLHAFKTLYSLTWHDMLRGIKMSCQSIYFNICPSESNHSFLELSIMYITWHDMACYGV